MDINSNKIKAARNSKGWTQQHLADVCELSLRTIQRVEKHGAGSNETVLSLCSVLEVELNDIQVLEEKKLNTSIPVKRLLLIVIPAILIGSAVGASLTYAILK